MNALIQFAVAFS